MTSVVFNSITWTFKNVHIFWNLYNIHTQNNYNTYIYNKHCQIKKKNFEYTFNYEWDIAVKIVSFELSSLTKCNY